MGTALLVLTAFLASAVEMVEALTILLAVGITRGWREALSAAALALLTLGIVVGLLGPSLVILVPLRGLQILVGTLLLIFGMQWLRKAILRASGRKSLHDEDAIFRHEVESLSAVAEPPGFHWNGFVVAFKGVFLEGLEVAFIVLTFGANEGRFGPSIAGALIAFLLVALVGVLVHRPLSRVPENAMKFAVGLALITFGTFWGGEGVGIEWVLGDVMLLVLLAFYAAVAAGMVHILREPTASRHQGTTEVAK
jgi:uncharacterized membrane protein